MLELTKRRLRSNSNVVRSSVSGSHSVAGLANNSLHLLLSLLSGLGLYHLDCTIALARHLPDGALMFRESLRSLLPLSMVGGFACLWFVFCC